MLFHSVKCPAPLKNRDYVNQRSWKVVLGQQYVVFNHSVSHEVCTVDKLVNTVKTDLVILCHRVQYSALLNIDCVAS